MRLLLTISVILATFFSSCDPCKNLDCISDNFFGQFRITSASTGNDLVFGSNRVYDKDQIRFYSLKGTDTTFLDYQPIRYAGTGYDSVLYVHFFPPTDVAYMRLSNGDIDTLHISYNTRTTKCCGTITEITKFRFNNMVDIPVDNSTPELKK
ncbi:hypothetical protein [Aridibaculum aurantiacum]|uniref:hypothetical protein n=1 Tax=Aridibaculum aurantiacum TaxID=2810307 RepID=UPI001A969F88|nr:hypothetical protein [Aridibaculum aurantiacum]